MKSKPQTRPARRNNSADCPEPDATVPPYFYVCGSAKFIPDPFYVYLVLVKPTGERECAGPYEIRENPWCVQFDEDVAEGTYNLYVHVLSSTEGVNCKTVDGKSEEVTFISNLTVKIGASDPCLRHRERIVKDKGASTKNVKL